MKFDDAALDMNYVFKYRNRELALNFVKHPGNLEKIQNFIDRGFKILIHKNRINLSCASTTLMGAPECFLELKSPVLETILNKLNYLAIGGYEPSPRN